MWSQDQRNYCDSNFAAAIRAYRANPLELEMTTRKATCIVFVAFDEISVLSKGLVWVDYRRVSPSIGTQQALSCFQSLASYTD